MPKRQGKLFHKTAFIRRGPDAIHRRGVDSCYVCTDTKRRFAQIRSLIFRERSQSLYGFHHRMAAGKTFRTSTTSRCREQFSERRAWYRKFSVKTSPQISSELAQFKKRASNPYFVEARVGVELAKTTSGFSGADCSVERYPSIGVALK